MNARSIKKTLRATAAGLAAVMLLSSGCADALGGAGGGGGGGVTGGTGGIGITL